MVGPCSSDLFCLAASKVVLRLSNVFIDGFSCDVAQVGDERMAQDPSMPPWTTYTCD